MEWASQNMLVLGIIVILGLALHFVNFWYKMQFAEIIGNPMMGGLHAADGYGYIMQTFSNPLFFVLVYHLVNCFVVPPDSRFLELNADSGMEQYHLD